MAREALKILHEVTAYVPEIDNNRDDPEPFEVDILPLTAGEMKAEERAMGKFTGGEINFTDRAQKQLRAIFTKRVPNVRRYSIPHRVTGARIEPKTGLALYEAILEHGDDHEATILDDIYRALRENSHLRAGLPETLRSRSDSRTPAALSQQNPPGSGAVSDAVAKTNQIPTVVSTMPPNGSSEAVTTSSHTVASLGPSA